MNRATQQNSRHGTKGKSGKKGRWVPPPKPKHALRLLVWGVVAIVVAAGAQWLLSPVDDDSATATATTVTRSRTGAAQREARWQRILESAPTQPVALNG